MKKIILLPLFLIIMSSCKTTFLEQRTSLVEIDTAFYQLEIAGLKGVEPRIEYEIIFSKALDSDVNILNVLINDKEKKISMQTPNKIIISENASHLRKHETKFKYKIIYQFNLKAYEIEGVFKKTDSKYRP